MPRKTLQRFLPDAAKLHDYSALRWITLAQDKVGKNPGKVRGWLSNPQLWHLNRRSVSGAVAVGLFIGWLPIPLQMLVAAFLANVLHVNLLVSVILVWISNPLTFPALLYAAYSAGTTLLGMHATSTGFEPSLAWVATRLGEVWLPVLTGSLFMGALSAVIGFMLVRILWRIKLVKRWQERRVRIAMRVERRPAAPSRNGLE